MSIFGGNTGVTYEQLQARRKIAENLRQGMGGTPRNIGEGVHAIAKAFSAKAWEKQNQKDEAKLQSDFNTQFSQLTGSFGPSTMTQATAPANGGMEQYRNAIASIESAGSGDYQAIGPTNPKLGRALGRYQIMEANIGPWSREALGREVTPDEFLANPQLQDAIFDHKFGGYVQQFGPEGAAQAWFAGPGGVGKMDRKDVLGTTVGDYTQKFSKAVGGPSGGAGGQNMQLITQLAGLASNPMASPAQKAIVETLLQRQMQTGDPAYQLDMRYKQAQLDQLQQPQAGYRQVRGADLGLTGPQADMLFNQGPDGKITQIGGGGTVVNNNMGNPVEPLGTEGQILVQDPNAPGGYRVEIAPGSKLDAERQQSAQQSEIAQQQKETSTGIVLDEISLARDLISNQTMFNPTTGVTGKAASLIDSTNAGKLKNRLETIKANIGFDKLQAMREASPTGGALGAVSEFENRLLQAVYGSLEQAQDDQELLYNLDRLESVYNRVINEGIPDDEARQLYREIVTGEAPKAQAIPSEPPSFLGAQDLELWPFFTDEEKAAILKSYGQGQ